MLRIILFAIIFLNMCTNARADAAHPQDEIKLQEYFENSAMSALETARAGMDFDQHVKRSWVVGTLQSCGDDKEVERLISQGSTGNQVEDFFLDSGIHAALNDSERAYKSAAVMMFFSGYIFGVKRSYQFVKNRDLLSQETQSKLCDTARDFAALERSKSSSLAQEDAAEKIYISDFLGAQRIIEIAFPHYMDGILRVEILRGAGFEVAAYSELERIDEAMRQAIAIAGAEQEDKDTSDFAKLKYQPFSSIHMAGVGAGYKHSLLALLDRDDLVELAEDIVRQASE